MTADAVGGVWTYAVELAEQLASRGAAVTLATMGPPPNAVQRREAAAIAGLTLRESVFKLEWMADPWEDLERAGEWLLGLAEEFRPDLIHLNGYVHGSLPWNRPCVIVAHSCVMSWWEAVKKEPPPATLRRYHKQVHRGLNAASLVAAPTGAMLENTRRHYGPHPNSRVIRNGRSRRLFPTGAKDNLILSVGRLWDEAKNMAALQRVAADLPWRVAVAGADTHPDGEARHLENVIRLGALSPLELAPWYSRAAIYALPARYEPFGLTVLEAAIAGCALVLGDIPSLQELWEGAALFVPPEDSAALREALVRLCSERRFREELAALAEKRSHDYSPVLMAEGYLEAYRSLLPPDPD